MSGYANTPIYCLKLHNRHVVSSSSMKHLFRVIAQCLEKRLTAVTVHEAVISGFKIERIG